MKTRRLWVAFLAAGAATVQSGCKATTQGNAAAVKEFTVVGGAKGQLTATVDGAGLVTFSFNDGTNGDNPVTLIGQEAGAKEMVSAVAKDSGKALIWKGVEVGAIDGGGNVSLCTGATEWVCDAQVEPKGTIDPVSKAASNLSMMRLALTMEYMSKSGASGGLGLADSGVLDISQYAMPEINQSYAATCLYNSTTAIMEWYRNRALGVRERLSAPDVLARLDAAAGYAVGERYAIENTSKLVGVLPDQYLPTQATYDAYGRDHNTGFGATSAYANQQSPRFAANRVPVPGPLHGKVLYMISEPARGVGGAKGVELADIQKVRDWIATYHTPVHFFAYYGPIWHAIVALGYRDDGWLLIKDSLQVKADSAHWVSLLAYQQNTYGAVGTWSDDKTIGAGSSAGAAATPTTGGATGIPATVAPTTSASGQTPAAAPKCQCVRIVAQQACGLRKDGQWAAQTSVAIVAGQTQDACSGDFCRQWLAADVAASCSAGVEDSEYTQ